MDNIVKEERSRVMGLVRQKNTKPELIVRSSLHKLGLRYRLHDKNLPGKPDMVFMKHKMVLFVNGCFWHGHPDPSCKLARTPKSNIRFWKAKIKANRTRDIAVISELNSMGWKTVIVWECAIMGKKSNADRIATEIFKWIITAQAVKQTSLEFYHSGNYHR